MVVLIDDPSRLSSVVKEHFLLFEWKLGSY
jgi:hypothetical protein